MAVTSSKGNLRARLRSGAASLDFPHTDITSGGPPLTDIGIGTDLSCQVTYSGDSSYEFYGPNENPGDCGTFLSVGGVLYAPDFAHHDYTATQSLGSYTPFTSISQSGVSGSGATSDPYEVVTHVAAGTSGLGLTEVDRYVTGASFYRTDVSLTNSTSSAQTVILYRGEDDYLANSDFCTGLYDSSTGPSDALPPTRAVPLN